MDAGHGDGGLGVDPGVHEDPVLGHGHDDVPDDAEDELIKRLAERDEVSSTYDDDTQSTTEAQEEDATA